MDQIKKNVRFTIIICFLFLILFFLFITNASATTVELAAPKILPTQLREGEQINFTIKIKDYNNYDNPKYLRLETSLILSGDKPLYDFGELNEFINENRYQQKISLNLSSLPQKAFIYVSIYGKAPEGEIRVKCDKSDLIFSKFQVNKLKLYEVLIDEKLVGIELYELIINKKENFEKTMQQIGWNELDGMKRESRKLFDLGLVTEAQNLATEMNKIKRPDNLLLFGLITIENDFWINLVAIGLILASGVIGYILGSRKPDDEEV